MLDVQVKEIIQERNKKARRQKDREKELIAKRDELVSLWNMSQQISGLTVEKQKLLFGSEASAQIMLNSGKSFEECIELYEKAIEAVHTLAERYSRSTVNIAVIGKIGSGKSRLLQSISGLGNECIPSLPGTSCTGVTSVLKNMDKQGVEANLTFKAEEDIVHDINNEIQQINNTKLLGEVINIRPISSLDREDIEEALEPLKIKLERHDRQYNSGLNEKKMSGEEVKRLDIARGLIENYLKSWDEWRCHVGKEPEILTEVKDIEDFVSKQKYHNYIAVKKAVIKTNFPYTDAEIQLIDTVGIGDSAADTKERMEEVLRDESDAVIFVIKGPERTQPVPLPEHIPALDELDKIYEQNKEKNIGIWMSFFINFIKLPDEKNTLVKRKALEVYLQGLESCPAYPALGKNGIRIKQVVDMSEQSEVNSMMNTFLEQISDNLLQVDARLEDNSQVYQQTAERKEYLLKEQLKHLTVSSEIQRTQNQIAVAMEKCFKRLYKELQEYCQNIAVQNRSILKERLDWVCALIQEKEDYGQNSLDEIVQRCCEGGEASDVKRFLAFEELNGVVKEIGSRPALERRETDVIFKQVIANKFVNSLELDLQTLGKVYNTDICMDDKHFWEKMADMLLNGVMKAEPIRDAFISLDQFATDESIGITKSLFNYYAARFLNPLSATGLQPYEVREGIYEGCQDIAVDSVIRNADEFREKLKREMISQLNLFLKEFETVFDDQGSERYLVDSSFR